MVAGPDYDSRLDQPILEKGLRERVGAETRISFRVVESIPRTRSGKFRAVVSNLPLEIAWDQEQRATAQA